MKERVKAFVADLGPAGVVPLALLVGLAGVQYFDLVAFGVLAPDIRHTFGVSSGTITVIASLTAAVPIFFAVVLGYYGDRRNRVRLTVAAAFLWGATALVSGLAPVLLVLVFARLVGGIGLLSAETISPSLLSDYYPPRVIGAVFGVYRTGAQGLLLLGGPLAGAIAAVSDWRAAFVILAVPTVVLAFAALAVLREPARGASQGLEAAGEEHGSILEGYRRIRAVASLRRTWGAAFLFGGGTIPFVTILSTFFKDVYHTGDTVRGLLTGLYGVGGLAGIVVGGWLTQRAMRAGRLRRLPVINGLMIVEFGVGILVMAAVPVFALSAAAATVLSIGAFGYLPAYTTLVSAVVAPRVRSQAYGWSLFFYALGGITVSVLIGAINDANGPRTAFAILSAVVVVGGLIQASVRRTIEADVARAGRLTEAIESPALLSCRGVDAGYGGVQVLFGVDFEVHEGEMVALLGTNGAGKSTFLKAITGLVDPAAGAVSFDGRDITHADPMACARLGVMHVPGGRGVFPTVTVADNLKVAGWQFRKDKRYLDDAVERVLGYFPVLRERWDTLAGDLSGGEQQMLSLAQAFIAEPKLLLVDELSLGLAPVLVQQLVDILRAIHSRGTTIVLVEQSVNTALDLAERAVFMEKGEVRFSGPTAELLERPDILRAVFLQGTANANGGNGKAAAPRKPVRGPKPEDGEVVPLAAVELSKRYGGVTAVDGVSFEVQPGEILGFIGPNGAGKTSLFDLLSGFSVPDAGRVLLHGRDVTRLGAAARATAGLGRSFQDARLWPALTVAECLAVALHREGESEAALPAMLGPPRVADSERMIHAGVDELIETMRLTAFRNKFVNELSTGTRRIVELTCLLAHRPSVLLLDEPSSGIAQRETEALGPLLKDLRDRLGCAMLVIEHDMPLISSLADRLVALDLGQVVATGAPAAVLADPHVIESYLGAPEQRKQRPVAAVASNGGTQS
jgi:branched-chain amino acid transport system ATP-binding protein